MTAPQRDARVPDELQRPALAMALLAFEDCDGSLLVKLDAAMRAALARAAVDAYRVANDDGARYGSIDTAFRLGLVELARGLAGPFGSRVLGEVAACARLGSLTFDSRQRQGVSDG